MPDLAALGPRPKYGWLNRFLIDSLNKMSKRASTVSITFSCRLMIRPSKSLVNTSQAILSNKEQKTKAGTEDLQLTSSHPVEVFISILLPFLASCLLVIPISVLVKLQPTSLAEVATKNDWQILTVFLSTLLFSVSCSVLSKGEHRREVVFTATAAYSAVLVIFLGNSSNVMVANPS